MPNFTAAHSRQLRAIILATAEKCRVKRNGEVHAYGRMTKPEPNRRTKAD